MSGFGALGRCGLLAGTLAFGLAGCASSYSPTPVPTPTRERTVTASPGAQCSKPLASFDPGPLPEPAKMPAGSTMAKFTERGRLVVGVSADAVPMASRNPLNGGIEGFEIDLARGLTKAMFGDEGKLELRITKPEQVAESLSDGTVDLVVRQVGMTCGGWDQYAMSASYLSTGIRVLGKANSALRSPAELRHHSVCAAAGSAALNAVADPALGADTARAGTTTECMMKFQRGEVEFVAGDAPVLAGLARQDPFAAVANVSLGQTDYAVAVQRDRTDLVRFINAALAQRVSSGEWTSSWNKWARPYAGEATAPAPSYGRPG